MFGEKGPGLVRDFRLDGVMQGWIQPPHRFSSALETGCP